jgi:hypothetical protein
VPDIDHIKWRTSPHGHTFDWDSVADYYGRAANKNLYHTKPIPWIVTLFMLIWDAAPDNEE